MTNIPDFSPLFYFSPFPTWIFEEKTYQILDVNQTAIDHYGYSKEDFLALTIKDLSTKETSNILAPPDGADSLEGNINFGTFTHQKKSGEIIRVEINGHKINFQGKNCIMVVCQDVTTVEKQFRQSQEAIHIINASLDVICTIDENGKFISVSNAAIDAWGYQPEELMGEPYLELVHKEDRNLTEQVAKDIMSGRSVTIFENRYIKKNGDVAYNIWSARWDPATKVMYAIARDATEKKKADEVLAESENRFKVLVQEGSDLIAILDEEGNYKYVSPTSLAVLGYTPEDFIGKSPFEFIHPEDAEKAMQSLGKIATENLVTIEPFRFKNKDGEWRWIETVLTNMIANPAIQGIVANSRDITNQKNEEQHLKLLQSVITHTNDAVLITEAESQDEPGPRIIYVNEAFTRMTGYSADEVIGKSPRLLQGPKSDKKELARLGKALRNWESCETTTANYKKEEFVPAVGTELETVYRKVAKAGKPISLEYWYPGDESWYELNVYPFSGGVSSYFKNIDERKKAALEIQKAFEEKNKILESIGDAFFALDKNWTVTYWNKEAEHVLGRNREEILGKNLWEVYADAIELDFYKQYHKAMASRTTVSFEEFYPTLRKWFEVTAYPSDEGLSVYFKDITLRKETDIRILQANERFEKVTQATTDAIWDWDLEKDILYRGEGFEKLFGYERNEKFQEDDFWNDKYHPKDLPEIKSSLDETINDPTQAFWKKEYRIIHQSGEIKTVIAKGVVIRDQKGKAMRMVGAISDITERIKYENELQELNKILKKNIKELQISNEQLEQFAFIASHDLQEPLRMISSFLNQIERKYRDQLDDKAHQYIHFATDGAKRMKQIILDLLQYSRAGKLADTPETINLNEPIQEYRVLRRRLIEEKRATISADNLPNLKCFKVPLVQTLHCLLDNAIKYSREEEPPVIIISALETETYWQISIEDNGIGIDSQFFDKVFIIFQRLHNRDKYGGTGIGLSIAKKNIEFWGGRIWIESELEKGTIFYFTIDKNIEI